MGTIERSSSDKMVTDVYEHKPRPRVEVVCVMDLVILNDNN